MACKYTSQTVDVSSYLPADECAYELPYSIFALIIHIQYSIDSPNYKCEEFLCNLRLPIPRSLWMIVLSPLLSALLEVESLGGD
jgi:hypothetical protein